MRFRYPIPPTGGGAIEGTGARSAGTQRGDMSSKGADARGCEPSGEGVAESHVGASEVEPAVESGWWDTEILKVLMGADVELDLEILPSACVEADEGPSDDSMIQN